MKESLVKKAFESYKNGKLDESIFFYKEAARINPALSKSLEYNIQKIEKEKSILLSSSGLSPKFSGRIAVVFHVYHEDVVDEILGKINLISHKFDLYVTTPLKKDNNAIMKIGNKYPNFHYFHTKNKGRDILPFLSVLDEIKNYDICLKIHTKKGLTNYGDMWRKISLESLLNSSDAIDKILNEFEGDASLVIAGPKVFYGSGRRLMYGNLENIKKLCNLISLEYRNDQEWGFFAGTMFWFRPNIFNILNKFYKKIDFGKESGKQDGGIEHAFERLFGLIPSYSFSKSLQLSVDKNKNLLIEKVVLPSNPDGVDPTQKLLSFSKEELSILKVSGDVNKQSTGALADMKVRGWIAKLDEPASRDFVLRIGDVEIEGSASLYRGDLEDHGIHNGCHAFEIQVPLKFANGKDVSVTLFDKKSGLPVAEKKYKFNSISRDYTDFNSFLVRSYTNPYVQIPFIEADKRVFSVMEEIAKYLCEVSERSNEKPLISIIMPTFNRKDFIFNAINSVVDQIYDSWELIIVDDASTDDTDLVLKKFTDSRIKYFKLEKNSGVSIARNYGLSFAKGDYIAYLDSDNTWDPRFLSAIHGAIVKINPKVDALYTGQLVFTGKTMQLEAVRFGMFNKSLLFNNNYIDLNCFVHKKSIINSGVNFDHNLKRFVDWDFISRISLVTSIFSIPVLLSNYHLESTENSLTGNSDYFSYYDFVREKLHGLLIDDYNKYKFPVLKKELNISVVIPSFNAATDLKECLDSLSFYMDRDGFEVIIVDNNSNKETIEFITYFSRKHHENVNLIKLDKNFGYTYAVNVGIKSSKKENDVLLLNNDAVVSCSALEILRDALYKNENYGMAVPAQILPANTETITTHVPYALPDVDIDVNISAHHGNLSKGVTFYGGEPLEIDFAPFFCVLIKRSTLDKKDSLDFVNGRHYRSDRTYCSYIKAVYGLAVVYVPNSIVYHKLQKSTKELNFQKSKEKEYELIFVENSWSDEDQSKLNFKLPVWNRSF